MTGRAEGDVVEIIRAAGSPDALLLQARPDGSSEVSVRAGEVIGVAGLLGSGADRMLRGLFGGGAGATAVAIGSVERRLRSPADAIAAGIGMVPGERALGLVMNQSVRDNILLPNLDALARLGWLDGAAGDRIVAELIELVDIRPRRPWLKAAALSGGNQQKVILAKWLARRVAVLLLDEPTQGIDIAAKAQIHAHIRDFVGRGGGALVHSSDLGELARLCDRVLAVRQQRIAAILDRSQGLDEPKLHAMIGG